VTQPTSVQPVTPATWTHAVIWTKTSFGQYIAEAAAWMNSKSSPCAIRAGAAA
jgi:hypothetical protein